MVLPAVFSPHARFLGGRAMSMFKVWAAQMFQENAATGETIFFHSKQYAYVFKSGVDVDKLRFVLLSVHFLSVFCPIVVLKLFGAPAFVLFLMFLFGGRWLYLDGMMRRAKRIPNPRPLTVRLRIEIM